MFARFHRWGMFWLQLEHDDLSFRANRPFVQPVSPGSPSISYFECTVLRQPNAVGIGIVDEGFQACSPGVFVGWPSSGSSYGYHGDDGLKFHNVDFHFQHVSFPYSLVLSSILYRTEEGRNTLFLMVPGTS